MSDKIEFVQISYSGYLAKLGMQMQMGTLPTYLQTIKLLNMLETALANRDYSKNAELIKKLNAISEWEE